jgi:HSP20 family protein
MDMTTLMRRRVPLDITDWVNRIFDDRLLHDRFGMLDREVLRVEEINEDGALVVRVEIPGIDPDKDVQISLQDGLLHIRAERRESSKMEEKEEYRTEFHYGLFERTLPLPPGVSDADVKATYKDGILEVRLPRTTEAASTTIPVVRLP